MRSVVGLAVLVMLAGCSREGIQKEPQFSDWSYRTRDREHNRYEGYDVHHVREEQWQTDPYWTHGEGKTRREARAAKALEDAIKMREREVK